MNVEIDEQEMQEYASRRMKERIDKLVESRLKEIDWYGRIDQTVFSVVEKHVTLEKCNKILGELDRQKLVESISKYLASNISEQLTSGY